MKATVFLGGGRITSALIAGLRLAGYDKPIVVHDRNPGKLRELKRRYKVQTESDLHRAVDRAELLMVAVRPAGPWRSSTGNNARIRCAGCWKISGKSGTR